MNKTTVIVFMIGLNLSLLGALLFM